ncbi:hypothetical protein NL676_031489 [Syzygium grande]|nr:hypothetical protein NL676_031489 [Syzygium grande]
MVNSRRSGGAGEGGPAVSSEIRRKWGRRSRAALRSVDRWRVRPPELEFEDIGGLGRLKAKMSSICPRREKTMDQKRKGFEATVSTGDLYLLPLPLYFSCVIIALELNLDFPNFSLYFGNFNDQHLDGFISSKCIFYLPIKDDGFNTFDRFQAVVTTSGHYHSPIRSSAETTLSCSIFCSDFAKSSALARFLFAGSNSNRLTLSEVPITDEVPVVAFNCISR